MDNIMACRICLATDVKLYDMCKYRLKTAYEVLTGFNMTDDYLHHICAYCGALLNKYAMFRKRCSRTQQFLELLLAEHVLVTTDQIREINQTLPNISHPYTMQYIDFYDSTVKIKDEFYEDSITPNDNNINEDSNTNEDLKTNEDIKTNDDINTNEDKHKNEVILTNENTNTIEDIEVHYYNTSNNALISSIVNVGNIYTESESDEEPLSKKQNMIKKIKCNNVNDSEQSDYDNNPVSKKLGYNDIDKDSDINYSRHDYRADDTDSDYSLKNDKNDSDTDDSKKERERQSINQPKRSKIKNLEKYLRRNKVVIHNEEIEHKVIILNKEDQIKEVTARKDSFKYKNAVYKCDSCFKGFTMTVSYKNHMIRHDPVSGPIVCDICRMRWPDIRALRAHSLMSHERKYICKICGHISKTAHKAREHIAWHRGASFTCKLCGATFSKNTSYLTHMRIQHPTKNICSHCGLSFLGEKGLEMHRKKVHLVEGDEIDECNVCRLRFDNKDALVRHKELGCDVKLKWCLQCGEQFTTAGDIKTHMKSHVKRRVNCDECPRTFALARLLTAHVLRVHRKQLPKSGGVCELCGVYCESRSSLINHQRIHSGEKPYACGVCDKRFRVLQLLQIHTRTHTGERPFACSRCPKAFVHKAGLNRHERVHTGAKPYICPQCGKSFSQSNSMKQHCAGVHMKKYLYSRRAANKQTSLM